MNHISKFPGSAGGAFDTALMPNPVQSRPAGNPAILQSICMICHCEILPDGKPGPMLPPARGYSHGCCRKCVPELCRLSGLDTTETAELVAIADATYTHAS